MTGLPCSCWGRTPPIPHEGHCCLDTMPDAWQPGDDLPCGHLNAGLAIHKASTGDPS